MVEALFFLSLRIFFRNKTTARNHVRTAASYQSASSLPIDRAEDSVILPHGQSY